MDYEHRQLPRAFEAEEKGRYRFAALCFAFGLPLPSLILFSILRTPTAQLLDQYRQSPSLIVPMAFLLIVCVAWPLSVAGVGVALVIDGVRNLVAKRAWAATAARARLRIVDRSYEYNDYAQTEEEASVSRLAVRLPQEPADHGVATVAWARVTWGVYERYKNSDMVPVCFTPANPREFVIDGE